MADKDPKAHLFKKGQSGNPSGRAPLPEDVRQLIQASKAVVVRTLHQQLITMTPTEVRAVRASVGKARAIEVAVASVIDKAITNGDMARLNMLLDRLIGRMKELDDDGNQASGAVTILSPTREMTEMLLKVARGDKP